ncbi:MAG: hypothetical protein EHM18_04740 [Acidobacteria bacterium]|nr:MAG: hypothetical protein EHM18_04740 [Acidobacteriota bacterium]
MNILYFSRKTTVISTSRTLVVCLVVFLLVFWGPLAVLANLNQDEKRVDDNASVAIPAETKVTIRLEEKLSTRRNRNGDVFYAEILSDVPVAHGLAIPQGTQVVGRVAHSRRAGRISGRAELKLEFDALQFRNGIKVPLQAVLVSVASKPANVKKPGSIEADGQRARDMSSVGVVTGVGTLIGSIKGGAKGAVIGAGAGAVIGLAGILAGRGRDLDLDAETEITIRLTSAAVLPSHALKVAH